MPTNRRRNLIRRRRRSEEDGEDDVSVATEHNEDSQSEASLPSNADDADADASDMTDVDARVSGGNRKSRSKTIGPSKAGQRRDEIDAVKAPANGEIFAPGADTDVMINGLKISEEAAKDEGVDFEALNRAGQVVTNPVIVSGRQETIAERRRRENEEYRKKREEDPAFIPNRGPFFMHDHRASNAPNNLRPFGRGRGRGRGGLVGPLAGVEHIVQTDETLSGPWAHDLHDTLLEHEPRSVHAARPPISGTTFTNPNMGLPKTIPQASRPITVHSFSTTREIGKRPIRVSLPGMKSPITFDHFTVKLYARLPNHRPPLRRDKPVRISLPDRPPRYIFPSTDRSFIFIPRALRPNQQGFGRGRTRGFGSIGGFSSRRTSMYGGSVYSPSVAMSRRSSLAREFSRDGLVSPTGSTISRPPGALGLPETASKPVVRLPPGNIPPTAIGNAVQPVRPFGNGTSIVNIPQPTMYPLPQRPTFRENNPNTLPMHQPRPQKAVSVAGIESPADTFTAPQQQEQQPFHQQVPAHMNGIAAVVDQSQYHPHSRQLSYPSQPSTGTPLSHIPERAIHAQPFQPLQQAPSYPSGYQNGYYYPPSGGPMPYPPAVPPANMVPMYMQNGQPGAYVMPAVPPTVPMPVSTGSQPQGSMVAHEANGTVYYYDPSSMYAPPAMEGYAPASYAVPGMGGMMTPSPDGYFYAPQGGTVYYPQPQ